MPIAPKPNAKVYNVTTGHGEDAIILFSWSKYQAYSDEEYKTNPKISFTQQDYTFYNWFQEENCNTVVTGGQTLYGNRACFCIERILPSGIVMVYNDPSISMSGAGTFTSEAGQSQTGYEDITFNTYTASNLPTDVLSYGDSRVVRVDEWVLSTNIPIFETAAEASQYIQYGDNIQNAINNNVPSVEGRAFQITNVWTEGTWTANGFTPGSGATVHHRDVRGRVVEEDAGIIGMYPEPGIVDGGIVYRCVTSGRLTDLEYSEDGITWIPTSTFPYTYFYRPRVDEVGTFRFALTFYTDRVPIFEDAEQLDDYFDGDIGIEEALNWPDISNNYPDVPGGDVPMGDPDDGTDWGDVYTQNFFANTYLCSENCLREIANDLYDTTPGGIWEDIKKGLDMFGQNPMEAFISLIYYPLDLSGVFSNISATSTIWFGGYSHSVTNQPYQLVYPDGYFYCGSVLFEPKFRNWRDTKAMRVFVDLPYCGRYELDTAKYWGKNINVIYYIDLTTGACTACLVEGAAENTREGRCLDQFNGQIGTKISMTLTDFAGYANAQINTLLGNGGQAVSSGMSLGESGANSFAAGNAIGVGGAAGAAAVMGGIQAAKTTYGLMMNNINRYNQTRGGSTGMLNQYLNQKPTFIFMYPETDNPANFQQMYGSPSNYGGTVMNFSGYFEADQIKLSMPGATESEKEKARALLMNGVYINR